MTHEQQGTYHIESDGKIVWVNHIGCVARFGLAGYEYNDLHTSMGGAKGSGPHGTTTRKDWVAFVKLVSNVFGVRLYDQHMPARLRD